MTTQSLDPSHRRDRTPTDAGHKLQNDKTVPFKDNDFIPYEYLTSYHFVGDHMQMEVLRKETDAVGRPFKRDRIDCCSLPRGRLNRLDVRPTPTMTGWQAPGAAGVQAAQPDLGDAEAVGRDGSMHGHMCTDGCPVKSTHAITAIPSPNPPKQAPHPPVPAQHTGLPNGASHAQNAPDWATQPP